MNTPLPLPLPRHALARTLRLAALLTVACLALPAAAHSQQATEPLQGLESFIAEGMERWSIPGLAVAVVKDDAVVYAQGFGVLGLEDRRPVNAQTLFGIASVSKAFTAGALGMLVDEGVLHWDDPVIRHIPEFRLYDPWVTAHVTIRDLLAHRVGVGRLTGNRLRWISSRPRSEVVYRVRYAGPEQPFRNGYVYSNVMYTVAGEIIPAVTGLSWDDFLETRIFPALGMPESNTSITRIAEGSNAALPHQEIDGTVVPIVRRNFDAAGPSAAINTSVEQLTRWMRLHLGDPGVLDGERILSANVVREMHRAQNRIPDGGPPGNLSSYGLGFSLGYHDGVRISTHGGATDGMNSTLLLAPELNLGVVVLTNTFNTFTNSLANRVLDRYMGIPDRDWTSIHHDGYRRQYAAAQAERDRIHAARETGTTPALPLQAYAGLYLDSLYADARVTLENGSLVLTFWDDAEVQADLEHWHHDTFRAVWRNRAMREEFVRFTTGWDGAVDALHIEWVLRPRLLQVGAYPSNYTREARMERVGEGGG